MLPSAERALAARLAREQAAQRLAVALSFMEGMEQNQALNDAAAWERQAIKNEALSEALADLEGRLRATWNLGKEARIDWEIRTIALQILAQESGLGIRAQAAREAIMRGG